MSAYKVGVAGVLAYLALVVRASAPILLFLVVLLRLEIRGSKVDSSLSDSVVSILVHASLLLEVRDFDFGK